jgi:hypothetical protein
MGFEKLLCYKSDGQATSKLTDKHLEAIADGGNGYKK